MRRLLTLVLLFGVLALTAFAAEEKKAKAAGTVPQSTGSDGMIVVKDAQTGILRAPTAEEARALSPKSVVPASPATQIFHPSGAVGIPTTPEQMSYSVAVKGPDGKVTFRCVDGKANAERAMKSAPVSKAAAKGALDEK